MPKHTTTPTHSPMVRYVFPPEVDDSNLPVNWETAQLPASYEKAKQALADCVVLDECADMANRMAALAAYARMSKDNELREYADRIKAHAVRRCGELLKTHNSQGRRTDQLPEGAHGKSQGEAARDAGLSEHQELTAVRVSNVSKEDFEQAIDGDDPATVTTLASMGTDTQPEPITLTAELVWQVDWSNNMRGVDMVIWANERAAPDEIIQGAKPEDRAEDHRKIKEARRLLNQLDALLGQLKVVD